MKRTLLSFLVIVAVLLAACGAPTTAPPAAGPTAPATYILTVNVSPSGAGSVSPSGGQYTLGTQVTLTATPTSGHAFDYWGGNVAGSSATITITMDSDKNVIAYFKVLDITAPVISGIGSSSIGETGATITWTTDEPATSQVEYGETTNYGSTSPLDENLVTSHSITLSELEPGITYHFRVKSKDEEGTEAVSGDYTFATLTAKAATYPPCKEPSREIGNWELTYEARITKGSNMAEVTIYLDDPDDEVRQLYLRTKPSGPFSVPENYITNLRSEGGTVSADSWEIGGVRQAKLLYTVNLNVEYSRGGYSGFASADWVITAGDFLFITSGWSGTSKYPHVIMKLDLDIPSEWESYTPYPETGPGTYDATGLVSRISPKSFIVIGNPDSFEVATQETTNTKFTVVVVEPGAISSQEVVEFISKVAVEYTEIATCIPPYILSVVAPEPMRRHGGEGKGISIFVSDDNPFPFRLSRGGSSTFAHELFHLYQKYHKGEVWIGEGIATYYQFYGPLKAGYMTAEEFWNVMVKVLAGRADKGAVLSQGGDPYHKGALITLALDVKIREDTEGKSNFDDVLQTLNTDFAGKEVSSSVLERIISVLTSNDYSDFFDKYVLGGEYPREIFAASHDSYVTFLTQELE